MSRLDDLKTTLARATLERNRRVEAARDEIRKVNAAYDELALRIGREIARLEPVVRVAEPDTEQKPKRARTPRKPKDKGADVWAKIEQFNKEHA